MSTSTGKLTNDELVRLAATVAVKYGWAIDDIPHREGLADLARAWGVEVAPDQPIQLSIVATFNGGRIYDHATDRTYALISNGGQSVMAEAVKAYNATQARRSEDYLAIQREFKATLKACETASNPFDAAHFARRLPALAVRLMEAAKRRAATVSLLVLSLTLLTMLRLVSS
jgi:hypothetical protein